jgi:hypothetical protein
MYNCFRPLKFSLAGVLFFLIPPCSFGAAIAVNGTCELGNCVSPGTLSPASSAIASTPFSFDYQLPNTDDFLISGTYSASGVAPSISFTAQAIFLGNATHTSSGADVISVDLLQVFSYNDDPDGDYYENATLSQASTAAGSFVTAELFFGGQGIGLLGPYYGTTPQAFSGNSVLTGLSNPSLADFNYTFHLAAGSPAVPEPATLGIMWCGACILGFYCLATRFRQRRGKDVTA